MPHIWQDGQEGLVFNETHNTHIALKSINLGMHVPLSYYAEWTAHRHFELIKEVKRMAKARREKRKLPASTAHSE